jgi:hypothetical protein
MSQGEDAIRDRRELIELLSAAMTRAWSELRESQRLLFGQNLLKTYVIEVDSAARENWPEALASDDLHIVQVVDDDLSVVATKKGTHVIVDRVDGRYALLHSLAPVGESDAVVDAVVSRKLFDRIWLGVTQLEEVASMGALRGFTTRFDRSEITKYEERQDARAPTGAETDLHIDPRLPVESLRLRLWGSEATRVLRLLRRQEALARAASVASVRLRYFAKDPDLAILDEIDYTGRVTSRGNSYELHRHFVQRIVDEYARRVDLIEQRFRLRFGEGGELFGDPLLIGLDGTTSPDVIAAALSDGTYPFRFVGVPRYIDEDYIVLPALDLHGGYLVDFEIAPELIRIYLRGGACGNSLMRCRTSCERFCGRRWSRRKSVAGLTITSSRIVGRQASGVPNAPTK